MPTPLRVNTTPSTIARNSSFKSIKALSKPFSSRRNSIQVKPQQSPFCEILVHGYGNGLNATIIDPPGANTSNMCLPPIPSPGLETGSLEDVGAASAQQANDREEEEEEEHVVQEPLPMVVSSPRTVAPRTRRPKNKRPVTFHFGSDPPAPLIYEQTRSRTPVLDTFVLEERYLRPTGPPPSSPVTEKAGVSRSSSNSSVQHTPFWSSRAINSSASSVPELDPSSPVSHRSSGDSSILISPVDNHRCDEQVDWSALEPLSSAIDSAALKEQGILVSRSFSVSRDPIDAPYHSIDATTEKGFQAPVTKLLERTASKIPLRKLETSLAQRTEIKEKRRRSFMARTRQKMNLFAALKAGPTH
ncbi:hypothetical protein LTS18_005996 [Coniosporium uncinatum]|uniref:Uncharacterized protein n=1 Tax=Coniosporium uncinatum TaxID=93489 RepID=A0ACC3DD11_9PEZI|nr:hypothetical protein LTS18_005996 [Coniosporium uncinatum]